MSIVLLNMYDIVWSYTSDGLLTIEPMPEAG